MIAIVADYLRVMSDVTRILSQIDLHRQDRHADLRSGQTTKTITIEVKGDSKREANETFYLDLFANSSNSSFTKNRGIGTILNDD